MSEMATVKLKKQEGRRTLLGHPWVFSNAVDSQHTTVKDLAKGGMVKVIDYRNQFIGYGYANPASLICIRLLSRDEKDRIDQDWISRRIETALQLRQLLDQTKQNCYRLIYAESDGLPGLVVDRYMDTLIVQISTAGMEVFREQIISALEDILEPDCIILKNDHKTRDLEQLDSYVKVVHGNAPTELEIIEGKARFTVPATDGQKTGWFYDQTDNRKLLAPFCSEKKVLDVCCYAGGWAIQAALHGATAVTAIDSSASAIEITKQNAARNDVSEILTTITGDAFDSLRGLIKKEQLFDTIVVDPPAFIQRKKDISKGQEAYRRLNQLALQLLANDGILISCSCSYHLSRTELIQQCQRAARKLGKRLQILHHGYQSADHPIDPNTPESEYLKVVYFRVV